MIRSAVLEGAATVAGTQRGAASWGDSARVLGRTGLVVAPIGFGGSRIRDDAPEHALSLTLALDGGINLVDTAASYGDGSSERLVGRALASAVQQGRALREQIVVVSKIGYRDSELPLGDELAQSLARLGLERLDLLLLHNPEQFLVREHGPDRRAAYDVRVRQAFASFEALAERGLVSWYGVSSNGLPLPEDAPPYTSLSRLVELAHEVGGDGHRFAAVQLPLNLLELGAATERHASAGDRTVLEVADAAGIAVLGNRTLSAIRGGVAVRLADGEDDVELSRALAAARKLEGVWADRLGRRIRTADDGDDAVDLFRWGHQLGVVRHALGDRERWRSLRHDVIAPHLGQTSAALLAHLGGDDRDEFARWWQAYGTAMHDVFTAIEAGLARPPSVQARIEAAIDPVLPPDWRALPLSRKAALVALSAPIACALVGMRRAAWVGDMLALREHPVPPGAASMLAAVQQRLSGLPLAADAPDR